jgi:hypothetical protein
MSKRKEDDRMPADDLKFKVFVGGPIQHAIMSHGFKSDVQHLIETSISTLTADGHTILSAHVAERFGKLTETFTPKSIWQRDRQWMGECDLFVAVLPSDGTGALLRTDGTFIELGWASALKKPIIVMTERFDSIIASDLFRGIISNGVAKHIDLAEFAQRPSLLSECASQILGNNLSGSNAA